MCCFRVVLKKIPHFHPKHLTERQSRYVIMPHSIPLLCLWLESFLKYLCHVSALTTQRPSLQQGIRLCDLRKFVFKTFCQFYTTFAKENPNKIQKIQKLYLLLKGPIAHPFSDHHLLSQILLEQPCTVIYPNNSRKQQIWPL